MVKQELLSTCDGFVRIVATGPSLPFQESFEDRDGRVKRRVGGTTEVFTVPSTISHPPRRQHARNRVGAGVGHVEVGHEGENHAVDAFLGELLTREQGDTTVDPVCVVEDPLTTCDRLGVRWRQPQASKKQECVGGGSPLRPVEAIAPRSSSILVVEESLAPANPTDLATCRLPDLWRLQKKVSFNLPANRRIALNKPIQDDITHMSILPVRTNLVNPTRPQTSSSALLPSAARSWIGQAPLRYT